MFVDNAGGGTPAATLSADGIEMTLATNHLGPALLTLLLLDLLKASAPSRIINVSSSEAQRPTRLDMDDLQFERRKYRGFVAYGQSKLLMNTFTFALARRLAGDQNMGGGVPLISPPGRGRASSESSERIHNRVTLSSPAAAKAKCRPSGDTANEGVTGRVV